MKPTMSMYAKKEDYDKATEEDEFIEMYVGLESLSKALEGSGRIDEHDHPDAYKTILMAMAFVKQHEPNVEHNRRPQGVRVDGPVGPHT